MPGAARPAKASQIAPIDARHALGVMAPEAATAEDVLAELSTTVAGLSATEAASRRMRYGRNLLPGGKRAAILTVLFHQFQSAVVYLLAAAAALAAYFGEIEEAGAIGIVLLINTTIGFATEIRAVRSIEALRKLEIHSARVRRDGFTQVVPAADLVPGDIVVLEAGDLVPADLRVIEAARLAVDDVLPGGVDLDASAVPRGAAGADDRAGHPAGRAPAATSATSPPRAASVAEDYLGSPALTAFLAQRRQSQATTADSRRDSGRGTSTSEQPLGVRLERPGWPSCAAGGRCRRTTVPSLSSSSPGRPRNRPGSARRKIRESREKTMPRSRNPCSFRSRFSRRRCRRTTATGSPRC